MPPHANTADPAGLVQNYSGKPMVSSRTIARECGLPHDSFKLQILGYLLKFGESATAAGDVVHAPYIDETGAVTYEIMFAAGAFKHLTRNMQGKEAGAIRHRVGAAFDQAQRTAFADPSTARDRLLIRWHQERTAVAARSRRAAR